MVSRVKAILRTRRHFEYHRRRTTRWLISSGAAPESMRKRRDFPRPTAPSALLVGESLRSGTFVRVFWCAWD